MGRTAALFYLPAKWPQAWQNAGLCKNWLQLAAASAVWLTALVSFGWGQGLLLPYHRTVPTELPRPWPHPRPDVPSPAGGYRVDGLTLQANVTEQVAKVQLGMVFTNPGATTLEAQYLFPLPADGAVESMTLTVDGKELPGKLLSAEEANRFYQATVRQNKDPALLQWMGHGLYQTSVFPIPPGQQRTVTLRYTQLCRASENLIELVLPLSTGRYTQVPIKSVQVQADVVSSAPLASLYCPTHTVQVERTGDTRARISYTAQDVLPKHDLRLFYASSQEQLPTSLVSHKRQPNEDGYFLLLAHPKLPRATAKPTPKTMVLVLDRSGSMSGEKIEQARAALKFVVSRLHEGDLFNLVLYDSKVEAFAPELERYTPETLTKALDYVDSVYAGGGTNIEGALDRSLQMFTDATRPGYLLFLTDGLPSVGEENEAKLAELARKARKPHVRMFTFGVGDDVNSRLLDQLARDGQGQSHYVRPKDNIETEVANLYRRIEAPVLTDVTLNVEGDGITVHPNRIYPKPLGDLFAGQQVVICGRYCVGGAVKVTLQGKLAGEPQSFEYRGELATSSPDDRYQFVETIWASRRVGELLDEIDLHGKNTELIQELVQLSTKHGILTPYTAFLADENTRLSDLAVNVDRTRRELVWLEESGGARGVEQRQLKARYGASSALDLNRNKDAYELNEALSTPANAAGGGYPGGGGKRGRGYGGGFGGAAPAAGPAAGTPAGDALGLPAVDANSQFANQPSDSEPIQLLAGKAYYFRQQQWQDAEVAEAELATAQKVARFSDDYFQLLERHGKDLGEILALNQPAVVKLAGKVYQFE